MDTSTTKIIDESLLQERAVEKVPTPYTDHVNPNDIQVNLPGASPNVQKNTGGSSSRQASARRWRPTKLYGERGPGSGLRTRDGPAEEGGSDDEVDVRTLKANFEETSQVLDLVSEFEKAYGKAR